MRRTYLAASAFLLVVGVLWLRPALAGSQDHGIRDLQGAGTYTWQAPSTVTSIAIEIWGGSGGGSRGASSTKSGNGGGGGAYVRTVISVTPNAIYTIVVGPGGVGGGSTFGSPGQPGGDTKIIGPKGTVLTFAGGGGGGSDTTGPGAGGTPDPNAGLGRFGHAGATGSGYSGGAGGPAVRGSVEAPYMMDGGAGGPARSGPSFHGFDGGPGYAILNW